MKILITGATGFVGSHLLEMYLPFKKVALYGTKKFRSDLSNVNHLKKENIVWVTMDITDAHNVENVIKDIQPDIIHHLAAESFVKDSWTHPTKTFEVNVLGSINLFEAVRKHSSNSIIHIASSSEIYGIPIQVPITEKMIPSPISPYGVSKLAMDRLGYQYHTSYGMKIIITRAFNHCGRRRHENFVCSNFAKQIVEVEKKYKNIVSVGNLESVRDFTDIRDMCQAYRLAIKYCKSGVPYNICSGRSVKISYILDKLIELSGISIAIYKDKERLRPSDLTVLEGDCTEFKKITGWKPLYSLEDTLLELLKYWRERI